MAHQRHFRLFVIAAFSICAILTYTYYDIGRELHLTHTHATVDKVDCLSSAETNPTRFSLPEIDCSGMRSVITKPFLRPYRMYLHQPGKDRVISDSVVAFADTGNYFEYPIRKQIATALAGHDNAVILDIGANIGLHAAYFASLGHTIHAFEPMKSNADLLKCTVLANRFDNVRVNTFGLSTQAMTGCMDIPDGTNQGHAVVMEGKSVMCRNKVELRLLSDYLHAENIKPYLIKIDIEGHELKALSSAREYLRQHPPAHIFSEFAVPQLKEAGTQPLDYLNFLWDLGYAVEWSGHVLRNAAHEKISELLKSEIADIHAYRPGF